MKTPGSFKKMDLQRAIEASRKAGLEIARVEIEPATGKITVVAGKAITEKPANDDGWKDFDEAPQAAVRT